MNASELLEDVVTIGSTVAVRDLSNNEVDVYTIVLPTHADILSNRISSLTPVARALHGRSVGEIVEASAPAGPIQLRIESIRRAAEGDGYG